MSKKSPTKTLYDKVVIHKPTAYMTPTLEPAVPAKTIDLWDVGFRLGVTPNAKDPESLTVHLFWQEYYITGAVFDRNSTSGVWDLSALAKFKDLEGVVGCIMAYLRAELAYTDSRRAKDGIKRAPNFPGPIRPTRQAILDARISMIQMYGHNVAFPSLPADYF